jgi:ABC-type proline/glycine betaine transport system permease subunit
VLQGREPNGFRRTAGTVVAVTVAVCGFGVLCFEAVSQQSPDALDAAIGAVVVAALHALDIDVDLERFRRKEKTT